MAVPDTGQGLGVGQYLGAQPRAGFLGQELPPGADDDVWAITDAERRALGIEPLPHNLGARLSGESNHS